MAQNIDNDMRLLDHLANHERALSCYYSACAERFEASTDFWKQIAREETAHAEVIERIAQKLPEGQVILKTDALETDNVLRAIEVLGAKARDISSGKGSIISALSFAMNAEKTMIERCFFSAMKPNSVAMEREFELLSDHTTAHIERLKEQFRLCMRKHQESMQHGEINLLIACLRKITNLFSLFKETTLENGELWDSACSITASEQDILKADTSAAGEPEEEKTAIILKDKMSRLDEIIEWELENVLKEGIDSRRSLKVADEVVMALERVLADDIRPRSLQKAIVALKSELESLHSQFTAAMTA